MNFIDCIICSIGERKLEKFRSRDTILKTKEFENYQKDLAEIKECYKNAFYWHGTGRYKYSNIKESQDENVNSHSQRDILKSIVEYGGLRPHIDQWLKIKTISATPYRMCGRLYAGIHQYEKKALLYKYGTTKFWFYSFLLIQVLHKKFLLNFIPHSLYKLLGKTNLNNVHIWVSSVRKDVAKSSSINPFKGYILYSDIVNNYPILVGIKKEGMNVFSFNPDVERLEVRSKNSIPLEYITHIEVPLSNVEETKAFLRDNGISLPVIPLEYGELYLNNFSFKELTY